MQNTIIEKSNVDKNNLGSDNNRVVKIKKTIIL